MDLTNDIQAAIQAHLPAAVGEQLQKRLKQADAAEKQAASEKARAEVAEQQVAQLKTDLAKHKAMSEREAQMMARERAVESAERAIDHRENELRATIAEANASASQRERDSIFKLAEIALGKRAFTERQSRHVGKDVPYQPSGSSYMSTQHVNENETTERSVEEIG